MRDQSAADSMTTSSKPAFEIIAVACSAGGLHALSEFLSHLPADFAVPIVIVQHLDPRRPSHLPEILHRRTNRRVLQAQDGELIESCTVYIAPPDQHLLVNRDRSFSLTHTEMVHFVRPSADLLFESTAASFRERAVAIVLTGTGTDGALGLHAIKKMGGTVIVQEQSNAEFPGMPHAAIESHTADLVLPLDQIPSALVALHKSRTE